MGYTIELAFDARKHNNVTETKSRLETLAYEYGCERFYTIHEAEADYKHIYRNHSVTIIIFSGENTNEINNFLDFIRIVKKERRNGIHIESVYKDDGSYTLLHASPKYLKTMEKTMALEFKKNRRQNPPKTNTLEYEVFKEFYKNK